MNDEETRSVNIAIPKQRTLVEKSISFLKQKDIRNKRFVKKRNTSEDVIKKFSLPVIKPVPAATFKRDEVLLPYIHYSNRQESERLGRKKKIGLRDDYRAIYADLQERLHTDDPPNDCRTVTDFNPDFFTCVNGTFIKSYVPLFTSLKYMIKEQLTLRQEIAYKKDCIINIAANHKKEQEIYHASVKRYKEQVRYFNKFISDDYKKSMLSLSRCDDVKLAVQTQKCELQCLAAKAFTITSRLVGLDYRYSVQQKYGRFLYYLSPPSWRYKNRNFARSIEIEAKGFDYRISSDEDPSHVMFEKLKRECYSGLVKPVLYFKHHDELIKIFDDVEKQHLHHFIHVVQLAPRATFLKKGIKHFKDLITQDSGLLLNTINHFKKMLNFFEARQSQSRAKFFKVLNGLFYESVGAPEVLKLQTHLEFCYEKIFNENPINMDIVATAKALEDFYMNYSLRLDFVTGDEIKVAMAQYEKAQRKNFRRAKEAARELRVFERLERNLLRAYEPAAMPPGYKLKVHRTTRRKLYSKSIKIEENRNSLSEAQMEYLTLFTDWTEKEDPANYLHLTVADNDVQ